MDIAAEVDIACPPSDLFAAVEDLARYPAWIDLVHGARPLGGEPPAWATELRTRVGRLARSKRLRMVRVEHDPAAGRVRFERDERDGRHHSPWTLAADVLPTGRGARLTMRLHYGGRLWTGGLLDRALNEQIERAKETLRAQLEA